jgi:hypothetical protein
MAESPGSGAAVSFEAADSFAPGWVEGSTVVVLSVDAFGSVVLSPGIGGSSGAGSDDPPSFP